METDRDDVKDKIFAFAYDMAMRDATLQGAFTGKKAELSKNKDARKAVKHYIDQVFDGKFKSEDDQDDHNNCFYITADTVCEKIGSGFMFGNAQKLINMTVKYMYIACYKNTDLREKFRFCHCPVDSYMLAYVWDELKRNKDDFLKQKGYTKTGRNAFTASWSREEKSKGIDEPARYSDFQQAVRRLAKDKFPIEYDYMHWTEAKKS